MLLNNIKSFLVFYILYFAGEQGLKKRFMGSTHLGGYNIGQLFFSPPPTS